jgi:hypothetical protein
LVFRIATWNLERPRLKSWRKIPFLLEKLRSVSADVWILTETNAVIDLSDTHSAIVSDPVATLHKAGENWTTIWSRYPARALSTYDPSIAVCAEIDAPDWPFIVYGTVLPYHADCVQSGGAKSWSEHYRVIPLHGTDWRSLRKRFPTHHFCVAGDLNQSRDGRRWSGREWYGTKRGRELLTAELKSADLWCITEEDLVEVGKLSTRSTIDHVYLDANSATRVLAVGAWEAGRGDGVRLSDHNGIYIDLAFAS